MLKRYSFVIQWESHPSGAYPYIDRNIDSDGSYYLVADVEREMILRPSEEEARKALKRYNDAVLERRDAGCSMKPNWQLMASWSHPTKHILVYRDLDLGCQMEVHTPIKKGRGPGHPNRFGKARRYWFIDGYDDEYKTEEAMLKDLEWLRDVKGMKKEGM